MHSKENQAKFIAALQVFRELDDQIKPRTIEVFLKIAEMNGGKMATIQTSLGLEQKVVSVHVGRLADTGYKNGKKTNRTSGHGLVKKVRDYDDHREKRVYLTEAGIEVFSKFHQALKGGFTDV